MVKSSHVQRRANLEEGSAVRQGCTYPLLKYNQKFGAERDLSINPCQVSHFQMVSQKTREGSHLSDVTQLKSETVYGTVMKSLDSGVRQMTNTRLSDTTELLN